MPPIAGWDELRAAEERAGLVRFEPHTLTHPVLTTLTREEARRRDRGLDRGGRARARPAGAAVLLPGRLSTRSARSSSRANAGCAPSLTCEFGANHMPFDHHEMRRTIVERSDPLWLFRARLAGATDAPPPGRRARRVERLAA